MPACLPLNPLRVLSPGRGPLLNTTRVFPESNCILLFAPRYEVPGEENLDVREMHLTNFSINWESGAFAPRLPRKNPAKRTGRCPGAAQAAHRHLATGARAFSEFLGRVLKLWEDSTERARERHNECVISLTESEVPGANVTSGALAYRVAFLHHMRLGHGDQAHDHPLSICCSRASVTPVSDSTRPCQQAPLEGTPTRVLSGQFSSQGAGEIHKHPQFLLFRAKLQSLNFHDFQPAGTGFRQQQLLSSC